MRPRLGVALVLSLCMFARAAPAQEPPPPPPDQARGWADPPPGVRAADVALFVPRVILAVPRYVFEVVFFPIRMGLQLADDHKIIEHVVDFLYNDARTAAILPTATFLTGFGPTIGVTAFHNDLFGGGESLSASARFGGQYVQAYQLSFAVPRLGGTGAWLESRARFERTGGLLFWGIGDPPGLDGPAPAMPVDPRVIGEKTRYSEDRFMGLLRGGYAFGPLAVGLAGIYNHRVFGEETVKSNDPSIETVYDTNAVVGFGKGTDVLELKASVVLDLRDAAGFTSRGLYAELFAGYVPEIDVFTYGHYGFEVTGFLDLYGGTRVLIARGSGEKVVGRDGEIPFSDLPRLGGPRHLRGYLLDRFRDEAAALGSLEYRYPVHRNVQAHLFVDAGKVGKDWDNLDDGAWRVGYGFGLVVGSRNHTLFALDLAYGDGFVVTFSSDPLRSFAGRDTRL